VLTDKALGLWGIDTDEVALDRAKAAYPQIEFIYQTAASLPFENN
jgi:ubiquinone/menaquinone biosynthesis C-methylase UbiE